ncbi:MAG: ribosome maturation factor RimM [Prosthecochloris sp.]|nr:ribosome maturation factor RimM [Prosthecochloris sp.]
MSERALYLTGLILKPKGLKGKVKVRPETDFPERFLKRGRLFVGPDESRAREMSVVRASLRGGFAYLCFEGQETREQAEALVGQSLYVQESDLVPLPPDMAYVHELVGLEVLDENRHYLGVVEDVLRMPAHEVYQIGTNGKTVLVPAIEEFVVEIDLEGGTMVLRRFHEFL